MTKRDNAGQCTIAKAMTNSASNRLATMGMAIAFIFGSSMRWKEGGGGISYINYVP